MNTNRLKFGNEATAQFDEKTAASPTLAAQLILDAICEGVRIGFFSKMCLFKGILTVCFDFA